MNILLEPVGQNVNLSLQGIDISEAKTFGDVVVQILEKGRQNRGKNTGKNHAERQDASIILPLRSAIVQQVELTGEERGKITQEAEVALTGYKIAQITSGKQGINLTNTPKEIEDWMSHRVMKILQGKMQNAIQELVGDIPLNGFYREDEIARILEKQLATLRATESGKSDFQEYALAA